ncbi:GTP 3',8-cyclase MoaA [Polycladidibacter stylochi]|uniref:GTP 3',8-cyclase MoaA n=1 Tax=Polycladidibacter stylochi TaxID=1807766 RepID=UPI00082AE7EE|nr:GTP 3',8-cyclase MoaA [Pseudovibrio stylochi]
MPANTHSVTPANNNGLVDAFGRTINYLRVSVTDRCDFRCVYCMAENMSFLPKSEVLTLEELDRLCTAFIEKGVHKLRLTGGEPLVRKNIMGFIRGMSRHLESGALRELAITTNGSQLHRFAEELYDCGVRRINVSLDTLDADKFKHITRWGDLNKVMRGIEAAQKAGLKIKINAVAVKGFNDGEIADLLRWCHSHEYGLTLIETMPMGEIDGDRADQYLPLSQVRQTLSEQFTLEDLSERTGGPARYMLVKETGGKLGFITPMSHNFCEDCNRVRLTCTGQLYMCLGQEGKVDLRAALRNSEGPFALDTAIATAIANKPKGHDFVIDREQTQISVGRHMSMTGG